MPLSFIATKIIQVVILLLLNKQQNNLLNIEDLYQQIINVSFPIRKSALKNLNLQTLQQIIKQCEFITIFNNQIKLNSTSLIIDRNLLKNKIVTAAQHKLKLQQKVYQRFIFENFTVLEIASIIYNKNNQNYKQGMDIAVRFIQKVIDQNNKQKSLNNSNIKNNKKLENTYLLVDNYNTLQKAKQELQNQSILAVDCEGVCLSYHGKLTLVQIAANHKQYLFDFLIINENIKEEMVQFLKELFENESILKIFHACSSDCKALYGQYQIKINNIMDTQILFKYLPILTTDTNNSIDLSNIGLNNLLILFSIEENLHKDDINNIYKIDNTIWEKRPLSNDLKNYAAMDVKNLEKLYHLMVQKLVQENNQQQLEIVKKECQLFVDKIIKKAVKPLITIEEALQQIKSIIVTNGDFKKTKLRRYEHLILELIKTDIGSKFIIQHLQKSNSTKVKELIFQKLKSKMLLFMNDKYGLFVIQSFFECCVLFDDFKKELLYELKGNIVNLSLQLLGSLAIEKLFLVLDKEGKEFILKELKGNVVEVATNFYGSKLIQYLLLYSDNCILQRGLLIEEIVKNILIISINGNGNFVIKTVLELGELKFIEK